MAAVRVEDERSTASGTMKWVCTQDSGETVQQLSQLPGALAKLDSAPNEVITEMSEATATAITADSYGAYAMASVIVSWGGGH